MWNHPQSSWAIPKFRRWFITKIQLARNSWPQKADGQFLGPVIPHVWALPKCNSGATDIQQPWTAWAIPELDVVNHSLQQISAFDPSVAEICPEVAAIKSHKSRNPVARLLGQKTWPPANVFWKKGRKNWMTPSPHLELTWGYTPGTQMTSILGCPWISWGHSSPSLSAPPSRQNAWRNEATHIQQRQNPPKVTWKQARWLEKSPLQ